MFATLPKLLQLGLATGDELLHPAGTGTDRGGTRCRTALRRVTRLGRALLPLLPRLLLALLQDRTDRVRRDDEEKDKPTELTHGALTFLGEGARIYEPYERTETVALTNPPLRVCSCLITA